MNVRTTNIKYGDKAKIIAAYSGIGSFIKRQKDNIGQILSVDKLDLDYGFVGLSDDLWYPLHYLHFDGEDECITYDSVKKYHKVKLGRIVFDEYISEYINPNRKKFLSDNKKLPYFNNSELTKLKIGTILTIEKLYSLDSIEHYVLCKHDHSQKYGLFPMSCLYNYNPSYKPRELQY